jgi:tetratricopeptide (TPR) repeat protein
MSLINTYATSPFGNLLGAQMHFSRFTNLPGMHEGDGGLRIDYHGNLKYASGKTTALSDGKRIEPRGGLVFFQPSAEIHEGLKIAEENPGEQASAFVTTSQGNHPEDCDKSLETEPITGPFPIEFPPEALKPILDYSALITKVHPSRGEVSSLGNIQRTDVIDRADQLMDIYLRHWEGNKLMLAEVAYQASALYFSVGELRKANEAIDYAAYLYLDYKKAKNPEEALAIRQRGWFLYKMKAEICLKMTPDNSTLSPHDQAAAYVDFADAIITKEPEVTSLRIGAILKAVDILVSTEYTGQEHEKLNLVQDRARANELLEIAVGVLLETGRYDDVMAIIDHYQERLRLEDIKEGGRFHNLTLSMLTAQVYEAKGLLAEALEIYKQLAIDAQASDVDYEQYLAERLDSKIEALSERLGLDEV